METVASYFAKFPEASQKRMQQIRMLILEKAPEAQESISYGIPAYKTNGKPLIYYAAFKNQMVEFEHLQGLTTGTFLGIRNDGAIEIQQQGEVQHFFQGRLRLKSKA